MNDRFDAFVVFAEMRTGSNFLEESINTYPGLECLGELFNPHFIGHAGQQVAHGVSIDQRNTNPHLLLNAIKSSSDRLAGFRFFNDHDPRILEEVLPNPRIAKVILTRNPVDSYVSHQIAQTTGQWRLGDMKRAKTAKATFDADEFIAHLDTMQAFQLTILRGLQITGQSGFYIGYDDLGDVAVLDGLARFLGVEHSIDRASTATKVQNPQPLKEKVTNFEAMEAVLAKVDRFNLGRTPNFEPRRGRAVPSYVAGASVPLLYQPIPCGPDAQVLPWLAALDGVKPDDLRRQFFQKTLRQWKRQNKGHRAFTVVRHPALRLHTAFAKHILPADGPHVFREIRTTLRKHYNVPVPKDGPSTTYSVDDQRAAFLGFAKFIAGNLSGQTNIRVDESWASQSEILSGMAEVQLPDMVLREERLAADLALLTSQIGREAIDPPPFFDDAPIPLEAYYDETVEEAVRAAYQRDYMMFGFRAWAGI